MKRIAIFASGSGTNAEVIMKYFELHRNAQVTLLVSNKKDAGALQRAINHGVETMIVSRDQFFSANSIVTELKERGIDFVVLAGFLWLIPQALIAAYPNRIVNIHPSLLPKFGGKGMFGHHVHEAVLASGEKESGITIHYVNEHFDEGAHIAQFKCEVLAGDTPDSLAERIHKLEHAHFSAVIEKIL